jgi:hypothetical protein
MRVFTGRLEQDLQVVVLQVEQHCRDDQLLFGQRFDYTGDAEGWTTEITVLLKPK